MAAFNNYTNPVVPQANLALQVPATKRKVTYVVNTAATKDGLKLPYAVAIDDVVLDEFKSKPKSVSGNDGKIEVEVDVGAKVSLYLNSDAHPSYRKNPVYSVNVCEHDVHVKIKEKKGKHSDADTPSLSSSDAAKELDTYTAPLTGDIWMKVTHKYSVDEVADLLPAGTGPEVKAAIMCIYEVLTSKKLTISVEATADEPAASLVVTFSDSNNPINNIVTYDLLSDGLPRVHPGGYAAVFNAALAAGVPSLTLSSAWRPCLGSIAHRAGLGLDVSYLGNILLSREELRNDSAPNTANVSEEEKKLFKEFEAAKGEQATATKAASAKKKTFGSAKRDADKASKAADKARKDYEKVKDHAVKGPVAKGASDKAKKASDEAGKARDDAEKAWQEAEESAKKATEKCEKASKAWSDERDKNQPELVRKFREALAASPAVTELFDPWFMDNNTNDNVAAKANLQEGNATSNERIHDDHLHITVREPKIR
jgi:hypothetical protein